MLRFLGLPKMFFKAPIRAWRSRAKMKAFVQTHPICASCGRPGTLLNQVVAHHIIPFHEGGTEEDENLIPEHHASGCHLVDGHGGNWKQSVPNVREVTQLRSIKL